MRWGLPIINPSWRTIGIVKANPQIRHLKMPGIRPVQTTKPATPPPPPRGFDENKGVSRKYFSRPKKTNNLQKVENREPEETRQKPNKEFSFQAVFAESFLPGIAFTAHCSGAVQVSLTAAIGTPYN